MLPNGNVDAYDTGYASLLKIVYISKLCFFAKLLNLHLKSIMVGWVELITT